MPRDDVIQTLQIAAPHVKRLVFPYLKRLRIHDSGLHNLSTGKHAPSYGIDMRGALIVGALFSRAVHCVVRDALEISELFNKTFELLRQAKKLLIVL